MVARGLEAVQAHVALGPRLVGVREVHRGGGRRAARQRVAGEAAGVGEEVQHAPALRALPHQVARDAMVEEETGVEVVAQVHLELQSLLGDHAHRVRLARALVLARELVVGRALAPVPLPTARLQEEPALLELESLADLLHAACPMLRRLLGGVVARARLQPRHHVARVPVHHQRELRDVALIQTERLDARACRPLSELVVALAQAVSEHGGTLPQGIARRRCGNPRSPLPLRPFTGTRVPGHTRGIPIQ